jgi:hypothetical protein
MQQALQARFLNFLENSFSMHFPMVEPEDEH